MTWNRKIGDLKLVIWLVTSPKNWWLEWTARLSSFAGKHTNLVQIKTQNVDEVYSHKLFLL